MPCSQYCWIAGKTIQKHRNTDLRVWGATPLKRLPKTFIPRLCHLCRSVCRYSSAAADKSHIRQTQCADHQRNVERSPQATHRASHQDEQGACESPTQANFSQQSKAASVNFTQLMSAACLSRGGQPQPTHSMFSRASGVPQNSIPKAAAKISEKPCSIRQTTTAAFSHINSSDQQGVQPFVMR